MSLAERKGPPTISLAKQYIHVLANHPGKFASLDEGKTWPPDRQTTATGDRA